MKIFNADKWFSRYIRLKYATESNGVLFVKCCTCPAIRQSKPCNNHEQGSPEIMAKEIDRIHGECAAEKLKTLSKTVSKVDEKLITIYYKTAVNELLKSKGWENLKWW